MSNFNVQGHIPSTGGDALMGAKHDKVKKERAKGQTERKKLQQYSRIDYNNSYGHG
jgi:hypothetical protein